MDKMKLKAKQISAGLHAVAMTLLTITLIISVGYAWYSSNQRVEVDTVFAVAGSNDIGILRKSVFRDSPYDENGSFLDPYPLGGPSTDTDEIQGLLSGETIYFSISVESYDYEDKRVSASLLSVQGGEYFTCPEELITDITITEGMTEAQVVALMSNTDNLNKTYELKTGVTDESGVTTVATTFMNLYEDSKGEFYLSKDDSDRWYRNYIYEDALGDRYTMCDVYFIKLCAFTFSDRTLQNKTIVEYVPSDYEKELYDLDTEGFRKFAKEGDDKDIPQMEVGSHVWDSISSDNSIITFTFALKFDFSALSGLINTNCVSSKQLVFEQVVMRSEVN